MTATPLVYNQSGSFNSFGSHPGGQSYRSVSSTSMCRSSTPQLLTEKFLEALDHLSTKLRIPMSAVEPTNALQDDGLVPGICRLYLEGRCRQGARCFQVHVHRDVLKTLRKEALEAPSCCCLHGAACNYEGLPFNLTVSVGSRTVGLHSLNPTNCLWGLYNEHGESQLTVTKGRVCREHRRGLCRFGEECGFLHICREVPLDGDECISATPTPVPCAHLRPPHTGYLSSENLNENRGDTLGDAHSHHSSPNHTVHSFPTSFNGGGLSSAMHDHYGNGNNHGGPFLGVESGGGSPSSASRGRMQFSARVKSVPNFDTESGLDKKPLLRPLGGSCAGSSSGSVASASHRVSLRQRHNPYGGASSFH